MNRLILVCFGSVAVLALGAGARAYGQYPGFSPYPGMPGSYGLSNQGQPQLSPYLNLIRTPASNYFLGTLPEFNRRANNARFSSAIYDLDQRLTTPGSQTDELSPALNETGHPVYFGNTGAYFPMNPLFRSPLQGNVQTAGSSSRPR